jgi:hypothetical protein
VQFSSISAGKSSLKAADRVVEARKSKALNAENSKPRAQSNQRHLPRDRSRAILGLKLTLMAYFDLIAAQ